MQYGPQRSFPKESSRSRIPFFLALRVAPTKGGGGWSAVQVGIFQISWKNVPSVYDGRGFVRVGRILAAAAAGDVALKSSVLLQSLLLLPLLPLVFYKNAYTVVQVPVE